MHFGACLDEVAHNLKVRHVLAGSVSGSSADHQPPLAIHDVRSQAATVDFLQAADEELQVNDGANHAQKTACVRHGSADQHHRAGGFTCAHHECFAVVNSTFAGSGISALKFALQEGVRGNSAGGNSFGLGVQQRGIGQVV